MIKCVSCAIIHGINDDNLYVVLESSNHYLDNSANVAKMSQTCTPQVIPVFQSGTDLYIEVYASIGLNECPEEAWNSLTADAIAPCQQE